ncbi:MAG: ribosomal-protein-alanine N-acetyltransferase [Crocinitomicaceae bacterium]|jgi:ribosomal-protein-alanine N-acetyltransferase
MSPFEITSKRLKIRFVQPSDLDEIHELHSLPETDEFNTLGIPESLEETKTLLEAWVSLNKFADLKNYKLTIVDNSSNSFIGLFGLTLWGGKHRRGEVWYKIHSDHWGKGYATEALNLILDYGFNELNLHRIQAGCAIENIGSIKVLEKVGMIREGQGRQVLPLKSGWSDNYEYSILETDPRPTI